MEDKESTIEEGGDPPIFDEREVYVPSKKLIWRDIEKKSEKLNIVLVEETTIEPIAGDESLQIPQEDPEDTPNLKRAEALGDLGLLEDLGGTHDLIYCRERLTPLMSPLVNYIPSREITFKLMLACVGCTRTEELWFN